MIHFNLGRLFHILAEPPLKGAWSESRDPFFKILPQSYVCICWC